MGAIVECYVIETDHPHVNYQKILWIGQTKKLAELYLPFIKQQLEVDIPLRITKKEFYLDLTEDMTVEFKVNGKHYNEWINRLENESKEVVKKCLKN